MFKYENIRLKQLTHFCILLANIKLNNFDYLKRRFLEQFEHFDEIMEFLQYYKLVVVKNKKIFFTSRMKKFIDNLNTPINEKGLRRIFSILVITEESTLKIKIEEFLNKFKVIEDRYEFRPIGKERIESAALRNLLLDFGIVDLYRDQIKYFIPENIAIYLKIEKGNAIIDESQFKALLLSRNIIGKRAEIEVINYERNRLKICKEYLDRIEHTALINVAAGYDIKSFDVLGAEVIPRYIEVKATSMLDNKFFWSSNEIQCAQLNRKRYYLYLVPIGKNSEVLKNEIQIIQDPYRQILNDKNIWVKNVELMSFRKILFNEN
jgi:hypothetical protein